jgi:hypothetical protein
MKTQFAKQRTANLILDLVLRSGGIIDEQSIQIESIWQNVVTDVVSSNTERLQIDGIFVLHCHFYRLKMRIHTNINSCELSRLALLHETSTRPITKYFKKLLDMAACRVTPRRSTLGSAGAAKK